MLDIEISKFIIKKVGCLRAEILPINDHSDTPKKGVKSGDSQENIGDNSLISDPVLLKDSTKDTSEFHS